jgi:HD superfamily phosphohydrolase YqeK
MKVLVLEDFTYSLDGFTILKAVKNDVLVLDDDTAKRFIIHGYVSDCIISEKEVLIADVPDLFSPVEETAVIEPVKEKKRRRKKKAE